MAFPMIFQRTLKDFGPVVFWGGLIGLLWTILKWWRGKFSPAMPPSREDSLQRALIFLAAGHALNYIVLRNLYIPHEYYLIPTFTIFVLALLGWIGDCRIWLSRASFTLPGWLKQLPFVGYFRIDASRAGYISRALKWAILLTSLCGTALAILAAILAFDPARESIVAIAGLLNGQSLGREIWLARLAYLHTPLVISSGLLLGLALIFVGFNVVHDIFLHGQSGIATSDNRRCFCRCLGLALLLLAFISLANDDYDKFREYYKTRKFYNGCLQALKQLRSVTSDDEVILSPDSALPFYAQRRSIICPRIVDIPRYRRAGIRYFLAHTWQQPKKDLLKHLQPAGFKTPVPLLIYRIKPESSPQK